jgi:protein-S-isoprenylcysteine O-methyltransferase Ste14
MPRLSGPAGLRGVREMPETNVGRAPIVFLFIAVLVGGLFVLSFLVSTLLGLPFSLGLPIEVRVIGGALVLAGLAIMGWVFSYRKPAEMMVSTYVTFVKLFTGAPVAERAGRTEPLVVSGPQKYVRNPLYFGIVVMVLGWAVLTGNSFVFIATASLLLWFALVLIPFEEREMQALFGEEWKRYSKMTPMLVPFTKRRKKRVAASS